MGVSSLFLQVNYIVYKHFDTSGNRTLPVCKNFRPVHLMVFGIQTEEQERQGELEKWTFCHISHVKGPIHTKIYVDIHNNLSCHPAVSVNLQA